MVEIADLTPTLRQATDRPLARRGAAEPFDLVALAAEEHLVCLAAGRTLTSQTASQSLFGATLTLETGLYEWSLLVRLTDMSSTSGNGSFDILGAGTATLSGYLGEGYGRDVLSSASAGNIMGQVMTGSGSSTPAVTSSTAVEMFWSGRGMFRCTTAGTLIPSIALTTAAAASVVAGSHMRVRRLGPHDMTTLGGWA